MNVTVPRCFYRNDAEWIGLCERLKLTPCPHCKVVGALIRHGSLRGFDDANPPQKVLYAHRIFCSNRGRRPGCGRTFSIFIAEKIQRTIFRARSLWAFLRRVVADGVAAAIEVVTTPLSPRTLQRFWQRFSHAQSRIRTALLGRGPPPEGTNLAVRHPAAAQVLDHLEATFPNTESPIAEYQQATGSCFL